MIHYLKMLNVAHIFACDAKRNSGDFLIGVAFKKYFKEVVIKNDNVTYSNFNCRDSTLFNSKNIDNLNKFDYILVGGGGLILPDTSSNINSAWQWNIDNNNLNKITKPIYVISIGYNLFFNQTITMPNRENDITNESLLPIFKNSITALIKKAERFTLRHNDDCEKLISIIGEEYRSHISYEKCATIWYVDKYWKDKIPRKNKDKYIAIEIKDDREWRRYYKIGKKKYYSELEKVVKHCIKNKTKIAYLSHDGSKNFYNYLCKKGIKIPYLDNACRDEKKIRNNYGKIQTILCSAGHSQMISDGCGIKIISLVTHPKIRNYCDDIGNTNFVNVNKLKKPNKISNRIISLL